MKRMHVMLLVAFLATAVTGVASAQAGTPGVDRRELRQRARIHQGWQSGALRRGERARLNAGQRHVHRMERRIKRDGVVTRGERHRMHRTLDRQSRIIYRLKHNGRVRIC